MARLASIGFETNSISTASNPIEFTTDNVTTLPTISTSTVRSGTYSQSFGNFTASTRQCSNFNIVAVAGSGPYFSRHYFNFATFPTNNPTIIAFSAAQGFTTSRLQVTISSGGVLNLQNGSAVSYGTSSALSANTWYRLEVKYDNTGGAGASIAELVIDGVTSVTTSTATLGGTANWVTWGRSAVAGTVGAWFVDDIAVNDNTGSFQNSYPGSGKIIHLQPNAAGDNTGFTTGVSDNVNHYVNVSEVVPDDVTSYNQTSTASQIEDYNLTNSGLASYDVVNVVSVGVRYAKVTSGTLVFNVRAKASSGGTVEASSSISSATTFFVTNAEALPRAYPLTMYDLPGASTTPWTQTDLDAAQVGVATVSNTSNNWRVSTMWMLVDYTPGTPPSAGGVTFITYRPPWRG